MDDLGSVYSDNTAEEEIFQHLELHFRLTGGNQMSWMVGINIVFSDTNIQLTQIVYLQQVLKQFEMDNCRSVTTLFKNHVLVKNEGILKEITEFQAIIGSLIYAAVGTQPDLAYATTCLTQFASNPGPEHWIAAKRILWYVKGTLNFGLTYRRSNQVVTHIEGYADASYSSNISDWQSFLGQYFLFNDCLISWKSKKQRSVATSTTEDECMSLLEASRQMVWLRQAVKDLGIERTFELKGDNTGSISLVNNPVFHTWSKHIEVHYHYVRECLQRKVFFLSYISTTEDVADLFMKGLDRVKHQVFSSKIHCNSPREVIE